MSIMLEIKKLKPKFQPQRMVGVDGLEPPTLSV